jgi:hypothetical protein
VGPEESATGRQGVAWPACPCRSSMCTFRQTKSPAVSRRHSTGSTILGRPTLIAYVAPKDWELARLLATGRLEEFDQVASGILGEYLGAAGAGDHLVAEGYAFAFEAVDL